MLVPTAVREVMNESVATIGPAEPTLEATKYLREPGVNVVVVVEGDSPIGVITVTDVVGLCADEVDLAAVSVRDAMSAPPVTISKDAPIEDAAEQIREAAIKRLPVVDGEALVGIITVTDLAYYLPRRSLQPGVEIES
jgi:CBS domain-containing protein